MSEKTPKKTSSSSYQVLGNKPIDQWKVTELKEELKRRKLITSGLKDHLVRRLDEALHTERESAKAGAEASLNDAADAQVQDTGNKTATPEKYAGPSGKDFGTPQKVDDSKVEQTDDDWVEVDAGDTQPATREQNVEACDVTIGKGSGIDEVIVGKTTMETITETAVSETSLSMQDVKNEKLESQLGNVGSKSDIDMEEFQPIHADSASLSPQVDYSDSKGQDADNVKTIETEYPVPTYAQEDETDKAPFATNQVSEVSPALGLEIKCDSISSVSIIEKNELKDNIIADNVKLELNVELEMVKPSSINVAPDAGGSHPMDVEDPLEKKVFADEKDGNATIVDKSSADVEYLEKLNLDRSSGDHFMNEDVSCDKSMDTENMPEDKKEQVEIEIKDDDIDDVVCDEKEHSHVEDKGVVVAEKRKLPDQQFAGDNEPVKRQRRWISGSVKVNEPHITVAAVSTTPKESISSAVAKSNFLRSDSNKIEDVTKECVGPPSVNPPTDSLRIDRFLRPFTLKAVQELLGKTGKVTSFWMDHIKSHCYVTYSSVEEAIKTRNAVYKLQWPTNGGRLLVADFVDPQEVKNRIEAPPPQAAAPTTKQVQRQQSSLLPPPPPPPPPLQEKLDPPIVTLDDLFRKTSTLPRIYYLPLSEEQVAEKKLAAPGKNIKA